MSISVENFKVIVAGEQLQVRSLVPEGIDGRQPTLVLLHEALGSITQWRDFPEELAKATRMPVLLYDRCGFGESQPLSTPRTGSYLQQEVLNLRSLLNSCGVAHPLLVGHSDGATLALIYAATFPDNVVGVISEAAHLFVEEKTLVGIRRMAERWRTTDIKQKLEKYHGEKTEHVFSRWTDTWLAPEFHDWNIEPLMSRISCPVLALQGDLDEYGTVEQLKAIASSVGGPCQSRLIQSCGHAPHHQFRAEVLSEMASFAASVCSEFAESV